MNAWIRGLFFAIRQLKREYTNLKIVAFLRTDIFEVISKGSDLFDSKSEITTISWDDNNFFSLKQLVAARIAYYLGEPMPTCFRDINEYWNMFYPLNIYYNGKANEICDAASPHGTIRGRAMKIIKRNGTEAVFDIEKIVSAITKANESVEEGARMTPLQIRRIAEFVELSCLKMNRSPAVEEVQDLVEYQIMAHGAYEVAKIM